MKFTLIKDLRQDKSMRPILTGLLVFTLFYLISDMVVKYFNFGIFPQTIALTLFGDEEQFIDPLSTASFLEFWHVEIFFMMMLLLTLSAVYIRLSKKSTQSTITLNLVMIPALLSLVSLLIAFFVSKIFVYIYSVLFILWHTIAIYMVLYSLWKLYYDQKL